jgi:ribosomal protein S18 acetylase RimI-like enzyme
MIQNATPEDIPALVKLINSAYRGESSKKGWTTEADLLGGQRTDPDTLLATMQSPDSVIWKYSNEQNEIEACVYLNKQDAQMYLGMLTVNPELQAKGLGKVLVKEAEEYAVRQGCRSVIMTVISIRSELVAWYERRGYSDTGERKPFPMTDPKFGLPQQHLEFIVMEKMLY